MKENLDPSTRKNMSDCTADDYANYARKEFKNVNLENIFQANRGQYVNILHD